MARLLHPIKTRVYRKFLKELKWNFKRIKGDHEIWYKKDVEKEVVFITNDKEVKPFIIQQNNKTLGISDKEFLKLIKK